MPLKAILHTPVYNRQECWSSIREGLLPARLDQFKCFQCNTLFDKIQDLQYRSIAVSAVQLSAVNDSDRQTLVLLAGPHSHTGEVSSSEQEWLTVNVLMNRRYASLGWDFLSIQPGRVIRSRGKTLATTLQVVEELFKITPLHLILKYNFFAIGNIFYTLH